MNKNDFTDFIKYTKDVLGDKTVPDNSNKMNIWVKAFQTTHLNIAKKMVELYAQNEEGFFKLPTLLKYKALAMKGVTYYEGQDNKKNCKLCGGTGFIQIQDGKEFSVPICKRCTCSAGEKLSSKIRQITEIELKTMKFNTLGFLIKDREKERLATELDGEYEGMTLIKDGDIPF